MQLEIAPLWSKTDLRDHEHISGWQILAVDYIKKIDQVGTYKTEREAVAARDRLTRAMILMADNDQAPS